MAWKKSTAAAIARFDELVGAPGAERGLLFGCPVYQLDQVRYATLFGNAFVLRLSEKDRAEAKKLGAKPFEAIKGRKSGERVVLPKSISGDDRKLKSWVAKAVRFARSG